MKKTVALSALVRFPVRFPVFVVLPLDQYLVFVVCLNVLQLISGIL